MAVSLPKLKYDDLSSKSIQEFRRKFGYYLQANKLSAEVEEVKLAHLKSAIDFETDELIQSFNLGNETCTSILDALYNHFEPRKNTVMNQFNFFRCQQEENESFQSFHAKLKMLAAKCEFGEVTDTLMKTRIILGIKELELQQFLLRNSTSSLEDIMNHCKNHEEAQINQSVLRTQPGSMQEAAVSKLKARKIPNHVHQQVDKKSAEPYQCRRCGTKHLPRSCPAFGKRCKKCADINIIPLSLLRKMGIQKRKLKPCRLSVTAYGGFKITPEGMTDLCVNTDKTKISLKENAESPTMQPPRRVAHSLLPKLKKTLESLESKGVIKPVSNPVSWVSNLVIVEKPSGDLRLCLDPIDLNRNIRIEKFLIPTLDDIKARLAGKKIFSVVDLKDGFYQVELDENSQKLCTFNSPFGYWTFSRLPFGISSAPEVFSRLNTKYFGDIQDVTIYFDDILIASGTMEEHLDTLNKIFQRAQSLNIKFNLKKFQYMLPEIKYLGLIFNKDGTKPDEERIQALQNIKIPKNVKQLQSVLGMFNYLRDFIPKMSELTGPLRTLLKKDILWHWGEAQDNALKTLIKIISQAPSLRNFDPRLPISIECDSSQSGLGCCLLQLGQPIAFASRSLNSAEVSYPQIEKELLAILFSCNKFHNYIYGHDVQVFTDHKPLVSIFTKNMCKVVSNRIQRMKLKLFKYRLHVEYRKGSEMYISDLLSRNFSSETCHNEIGSENIIHALNSEPLFDVTKLKQAQFNDPVLHTIVKYCHEGWPSNKNKLPKDSSQIRHFWNFKNELSVDHNNVLYYNDRLVIPSSMKDQALKQLHRGHMGIVKTKHRASQSMYWPNINNDIENFISKCYTCEKYQRAKTKETLLCHEVPELPFEQLGLDIMTYQSKDYLVIVDYFSKWIEINRLKTKSCSEIIKHLKTLFSNFGIPYRCISDNSHRRNVDRGVPIPAVTLPSESSTSAEPEGGEGMNEESFQSCEDDLTLTPETESKISLEHSYGIPDVAQTSTIEHNYCRIEPPVSCDADPPTSSFGRKVRKPKRFSDE
ncbi:hypothetical protein M8J77_010793 [Diaphorina citri]|nr:hypothetical protein M8J77_010793 [Diaphorina citri]